LGGAKVLDLEDQDRPPPASSPKKSNPARRGDAFAVFFWGWWDPVFAGGLQKRVVGRGFLAVNLWWIAGEGW